MSYMRDSTGRRLDSFKVVGSDEFNPLTGVNYGYDNPRFTVATDTATVTLGLGADGSYNRAYVRGSGAEPATWPVRAGRYTEQVVSGYTSQLAPQPNGVRSLRFMADNASIAVSVFGINGAGMMIYVDGRPLQLTPYTFSSSTAQFFTIVFGSNKTRQIEIVTNVGINAVYTKKPGKLWKAEPFAGPKVFVVGDSFVSPTVMLDAGSGQSANLVAGIYQGMAPALGVEEVLTNGVAGTGYITESPANTGDNNYLQRVATAIAFDPDMVVVHGSGANDFYAGSTVEETTAQAITYFTTLREGLPTAKLVFVEGFAPPLAGYASFNDEYIALRTALQAALTDVGVYYIDVATTSPWINGLGYVTNPNADNENSSTYVGSDAVHLTLLGHSFVRSRLAPKLTRVLRDQGELLNQLI